MAIKGSKNSKKCTGNSMGAGTSPQFYNPTEIRGYNLDTSSKSIIHQKSAACTVIFDTLRADDEKTNTKSQTLFFGIPKGTFYKKSPWAGFGAKAPRGSLHAVRHAGRIYISSISRCAFLVSVLNVAWYAPSTISRTISSGTPPSR